MQTETGQKYRVRYGRQIKWGKPRETVIPKNVLVTIQPPDCKFVFFGIARCKLSVDHFSKKEGREIALTRALDAQKSYPVQGEQDFLLSHGGSMGFVAVKYVRTLLRHFEGLDQK